MGDQTTNTVKATNDIAIYDANSIDDDDHADADASTSSASHGCTAPAYGIDRTDDDNNYDRVAAANADNDNTGSLLSVPVSVDQLSLPHDLVAGH